MDYEGYISGIDVIATKGKPVRCLAFVNKKPRSPQYIQVETDDHSVQTALEMASAKGAKVEVSYIEKGTTRVLTRVRLLDR